MFNRDCADGEPFLGSFRQQPLINPVLHVLSHQAIFEVLNQPVHDSLLFFSLAINFAKEMPAVEIPYLFCNHLKS
jgi:hypothetical protein